MATRQLMTVQIDAPEPPFDTRAANVAYALQTLQVVMTELGRCGGRESSGQIITTGADGSPHTSRGVWMFDASAGGP